MENARPLDWDHVHVPYVVRIDPRTADMRMGWRSICASAAAMLTSGTMRIFGESSDVDQGVARFLELIWWGTLLRI